jgi:RNA chaperone ProQ/FINO-like protein
VNGWDRGGFEKRLCPHFTTPAAALLAGLSAEFSVIAEYRPLALKIDLATCDAARGASDRVRRRALARRRRRYLEAVAPGGPRYALDGSVCGEVSKLQRSAAKARLEAITEAASRKAARLAKLRRAGMSAEGFREVIRSAGLTPPEQIDPASCTGSRQTAGLAMTPDGASCSPTARAGSSVTSGRGCPRPGKRSARSLSPRRNVKPFGNAMRPSAAHGRPRKPGAMPRPQARRRRSGMHQIRRPTITPTRSANGSRSMGSGCITVRWWYSVCPATVR